MNVPQKIPSQNKQKTAEPSEIFIAKKKVPAFLLVVRLCFSKLSSHKQQACDP